MDQQIVVFLRGVDILQHGSHVAHIRIAHPEILQGKADTVIAGGKMRFENRQAAFAIDGAERMGAVGRRADHCVKGLLQLPAQVVTQAALIERKVTAYDQECLRPTRAQHGAEAAPVAALAYYMTAKANRFVKTSGYLTKQLDAIFTCHQSQFPGDSGDAIKLYLKLRSATFGLRRLSPSAEGFRVLTQTHMHCLPEMGD